MFEEKKDIVDKEFVGEVWASKGVGCADETSCQDGFFSFTYIPDTDSYSVSCTKAGVGRTPETVAIPAEYNGKPVTRIESKGFRSCDGLGKVLIPKGVTSIGMHAFAACDDLETISIPEGVTSIEDGTFSGCESLESVTLPSSVTSIGVGAFVGCNSLTNISIPESVSVIEAGAFCDCDKLARVDYCGTPSQWKSIKKGYAWNFRTGAYTIYFSDGSKSKKKSSKKS